MLVIECEARYTELSRHATFLIPTEAEKVRRFIEGFTYGIKVTMARESDMETTFQHVVAIAWRIERVRGQGREVMTRNKRPRHFGGFCGTLSRVRGRLVGTLLAG